ncbi:cyanophycinase [Hymenobacter lutimineralis]|uniref:Cyanophycinase n=1 Tax=Hymenobacter lutimineralis TaxID=2606448 RepID=A0A5D6V3W4_9BACT|nr:MULTISPECIES: cyanophycinase [Hymenobacter]QIX61749.1 cyanophycinase [Hymenobacter sp. BT18]TYZ09294.1 cyanophycinase [Hymenobacter lutimineralis]
MADNPLGTLVALGGGDDDSLLSLLCAQLADADAVIEIISVASQEPRRTAQAYVRAFQEQGCAGARYLQIDERRPADTPATLRRLAQARLVFLTGGDQELITDFLQGTEFLRQLQARYRTDAAFVVAGTSAGAAALPDNMLVNGYGWRALRKGGIEIQPGLALVADLLIDQHFAERGRMGRLLHAVLKHPQSLGLGLAEETGVIIRQGHLAEVFGDGGVMVIDGQHLRHGNLAHIRRGAPIGGQEYRVHLLVAGQVFNCRTREVLATVETAPENPDEKAE